MFCLINLFPWRVYTYSFVLHFLRIALNAFSEMCIKDCICLLCLLLAYKRMKTPQPCRFVGTPNHYFETVYVFREIDD